MANCDKSCFLKLPYPNVESSCLNRYDTMMVTTLFANEFCNIGEHIYENMILSNAYPEIADIMECITIVEMRHFRMYGRLLELSSEMPSLRQLTKLCNIKSAHSNTLYEIVSRNQQALTVAISDIKLVLSQINDASSKSVLERILPDKEHHLDIFNTISQKYI